MNKIQHKILEIYKEVKRICEENNIHYYAIGGTAIGAVRHHGFIPWDDDMDLGIPIDDFERFKKICSKELRPPYEFTELLWIGGKIHDSSTTFLETPCLMHLKNYYGIYVDIFPLIGSPNDPKKRRKFQDELESYKNRSMILDRFPESSSFNEKSLEKERTELTHRYKIKTSKKLLEFSFGSSHSNSAEGLKKPIIMKFEDTTIPISSTYDEDLTEQYGDYMQIPPPEEQQQHLEYAVVDFDTSYRNYYQKIANLNPELKKILIKKHKLEGLQTFAATERYREIKNLNREIKQLQQNNSLLNKQLSDITNSKGWRTLERARKILHPFTK